MTLIYHKTNFSLKRGPFYQDTINGGRYTIAIFSKHKGGSNDGR